MQIFDLEQAADFLKMNPEVLRRKAKLGEIPGRKAGVRRQLPRPVSDNYLDRLTDM